MCRCSGDVPALTAGGRAAEAGGELAAGHDQLHSRSHSPAMSVVRVGTLPPRAVARRRGVVSARRSRGGGRRRGVVDDGALAAKRITGHRSVSYGCQPGSPVWTNDTTRCISSASCCGAACRVSARNQDVQRVEHERISGARRRACRRTSVTPGELVDERAAPLAICASATHTGDANIQSVATASATSPGVEPSSP